MQQRDLLSLDLQATITLFKKVLRRLHRCLQVVSEPRRLSIPLHRAVASVVVKRRVRATTHIVPSPRSVVGLVCCHGPILLAKSGLAASIHHLALADFAVELVNGLGDKLFERRSA